MPKKRRKRKTEGAGRVRMAEVARVAGVSLASVSRALRDSSSVSPEIYERVRSVSDRLGYLRNPLASSMSGAHSPIVAVIVPTLTNAFFNRTLQAIAAALEVPDYQLMIGVHEYDQEREQRIIGTFLDWHPMGLVVTGVHHSPSANRLLAGAHCPVVEMWDLDSRPIDSAIGFSMSASGRAAARHLIQRGRQRLVYVGHILDRDPRAGARSIAFMDEVERHAHVTGQIAHTDQRNTAAGIQSIEEIRQRYPETDGVAFSGDALALGALIGAERLGIRVPEDIAMIGFGDLDAAAHSRPPLTTIRPPHGEMGKAIAQHILGRMNNTQEAGEILDLGFELCERDSS